MYSDPNAPTKQLPHSLGYYGVKSKTCINKTEFENCSQSVIILNHLEGCGGFVWY